MNKNICSISCSCAVIVINEFRGWKGSTVVLVGRCQKRSQGEGAAWNWIWWFQGPEGCPLPVFQTPRPNLGGAEEEARISSSFAIVPGLPSHWKVGAGERGGSTSLQGDCPSSLVWSSFQRTLPFSSLAQITKKAKAVPDGWGLRLNYI